MSLLEKLPKIVEQYIKASGSVSDVLSYAKVRQTIQADQQKLI